VREHRLKDVSNLSPALGRHHASAESVPRPDDGRQTYFFTSTPRAA
jgi:hypothetical protein